MSAPNLRALDGGHSPASSVERSLACPACDDTFVPKNKQQKYCSERCQQLYYRGAIHPCSECEGGLRCLKAARCWECERGRRSPDGRPMDEAEIVRLWNEEGLMAREIAEKMNLPPKTLRHRLTLLRQRGVDLERRSSRPAADPDQRVVKARARGAVNDAIRSGRLVRPEKCSNCDGADSPIQAHHDDYGKPLEVEWLCRACHVAHHKAISDPYRVATDYLIDSYERTIAILEAERDYLEARLQRAEGKS